VSAQGVGDVGLAGETQHADDDVWCDYGTDEKIHCPFSVDLRAEMGADLD
jgi:hypothetical protein